MPSSESPVLALYPRPGGMPSSESESINMTELSLSLSSRREFRLLFRRFLLGTATVSEEVGFLVSLNRASIGTASVTSLSTTCTPNRPLDINSAIETTSPFLPQMLSRAASSGLSHQSNRSYARLRTFKGAISTTVPIARSSVRLYVLDSLSPMCSLSSSEGIRRQISGKRHAISVSDRRTCIAGQEDGS